MTYRQLGSIISNFDDVELSQDVTVYLTGIVEVYPIERVTIIKHTDEISDVLDVGHLVLEVRDSN